MQTHLANLAGFGHEKPQVKFKGGIPFQSCAPNEDRMPKLRPREVDTPNYPKRGPQNCWIFIFRG
jgi:hypothetical protein